jgi:hypothetical protein
MHVSSICILQVLFLLKLFYNAFDKEINRRETKDESYKMLTTLTIITTTTTATAGGVSQATVYGAIGVVILIVLLIAKELLSSYEDESEGKIMDIRAKSLATNLCITIYPLLFSFALGVITKVLEVL